MIVSGEQQRDSVTHIHVFILPPIPLQSRLPHNIEQRFLNSGVSLQPPATWSILRWLWQSECSLLSHVWLFATLWTVARQTALSMGFSRQEYWSGLPFPSPRDLSDPGIELQSPALQANSLLSEPSRKLWQLKEKKYLLLMASVSFQNVTSCFSTKGYRVIPRQSRTNNKAVFFHSFRSPIIPNDSDVLNLVTLNLVCYLSYT